MYTKESLFRKIYELNKQSDIYIKNIPNAISSVIFDNGYVEPQNKIKDILMEVVFGEHCESIEWFLYEWRPGYSVSYDGYSTVINNIDEYIQWMKRVEGFE